ncbi:hypothetical protein AAG906_036419 [Vitis piasezkii]
MEFPFGHHHHTHHHRPEYGAGEEEEYLQPPPPPPLIHPPPPPPAYFHGEDEPPPPRAQVHHISHADPPRPPPSSHVHHISHVEDQGFGRENYTHEGPPYARPPPVSYSASAPVRHVSHHLNPQQPQGTEQVETHHLHHLPGFLHHHNEAHGVGSNLSNKPTVRVFCKAKPNHSLTILDGKVYLAPSDKTDMLQHWIKDEKYSTSVKDEEGFPSFALVNKATGQAMKHSIGASHPVQLIPYNSDVLDESVLWTESKDLGNNFRSIRMINNIHLNVDALHGDRSHGGVHDCTTIVLNKWKKGDNQLWKISPTDILVMESPYLDACVCINMD